MKAVIINLLVIIFIFISGCGEVDRDYYEEIESFRKEKNEMFADPATSPLPPEDLEHFEGLAFFPIDPDYRVEASLRLTPDSEPFQMPMTKSRVVLYRKYGEAAFELKGTVLTLVVYQNLDLVKDEKYRDYLFLPFKDLTNGVETYGGGRYIDLTIPEGKTIIIDFNRSYNPYCAYNHKYSCPVPPDENRLDVEIRAGVMDYGQ